VGVAYGVWAGAGVALVALLSRLVFGEPLTVVMWLGFLLIIAGVWLVESAAHIES
jgi:small multidrug resistance pump